jgi:hypothetical protein
MLFKDEQVILIIIAGTALLLIAWLFHGWLFIDVSKKAK